MNERSNRSRKNMYRIQRQEIRNREDYLAMTRIETLTAALDQARINAQLNPGPLNDAKVERISGDLLAAQRERERIMERSRYYG